MSGSLATLRSLQFLLICAYCASEEYTRLSADSDGTWTPTVTPAPTVTTAPTPTPWDPCDDSTRERQERMGFDCAQTRAYQERQERMQLMVWALVVAVVLIIAAGITVGNKKEKAAKARWDAAAMAPA